RAGRGAAARQHRREPPVGLSPGDAGPAGRSPARRSRPRARAARGRGVWPDEVALIMNCSRTEASKLTEAALILVHRMPNTWAALADGELNWPRARAIAAEIVRHGPELVAHVLAAVEAVVLPQAPELAV